MVPSKASREFVGVNAIQIFAGLSVDRMHWIADRMATNKYSRGAEIVACGETSRDIFFVLSGKVSSKNYSANGREFIYTVVGLGECFGEFSAVDQLPRSSSVMALSDCSIGSMTSEHFNSLLRMEPDLSMLVMRAIVSKARRLTSKLLAMVANSSSERLRMELIRLAESGTRDGLRAIIDPAPTHYELAALVGSHREAVTKELGRLETLGKIISKRGHITIVNIEMFIEGVSPFTL